MLDSPNIPSRYATPSTQSTQGGSVRLGPIVNSRRAASRYAIHSACAPANRSAVSTSAAGGLFVRSNVIGVNAMRHYIGFKGDGDEPHITIPHGSVLMGGHRVDDDERLQPVGGPSFDWGGERVTFEHGVAAYSLLFDVFGDVAIARLYAEEFAEQVLLTLPDEWRLTVDEIKTMVCKLQNLRRPK
jgi:hypothetical protein